MGRGREAGHVHADLGDDPFGCGDADSRDFIQVGHRWCERRDLGVHLGFDVGDVCVEGVDAREHLGQQKAVVFGEVPTKASSSWGIFMRIAVRAISARTWGLRSPAIRAAIISRPETPKMSLATTESLIWASSGSFSTRFISLPWSDTNAIRSRSAGFAGFLTDASP